MEFHSLIMKLLLLLKIMCRPPKLECKAHVHVSIMKLDQCMITVNIA